MLNVPIGPHGICAIDRIRISSVPIADTGPPSHKDGSVGPCFYTGSSTVIRHVIAEDWIPIPFQVALEVVHVPVTQFDVLGYAVVGHTPYEAIPIGVKPSNCVPTGGISRTAE